MNKMWCLLWHDWSRWRDKDQGAVVRSEGKAEIGAYVTQERTCARCGAKELRTQTSMVRA